jgi:hypothetical protein
VKWLVAPRSGMAVPGSGFGVPGSCSWFGSNFEVLWFDVRSGRFRNNPTVRDGTVRTLNPEPRTRTRNREPQGFTGASARPARRRIAPPARRGRT